jgi:hypothetical protein
MKQTIKRHLISFVITFVASFIIFLYPSVIAGNWETSLMLSAVFAAVRSALKVGWEVALFPLMTYLLDWAKNYRNK